MSAGAVDNDCLKFLVPCGGGGEKRVQVGFGVDAIDSELADEIFADVVENVGYVSVGAVVADSLPDVRFGDGDEFFVFHDYKPPEIKKAPSIAAWGGVKNKSRRN